MVSTLFQACVAGDYDTVVAVLNDTTVDLETKDHTGCTPLIEAIKNGHVKIVQALLDKGADPRNGSGDNQPEQFTTDVAILDLLAAAKDKADAKQQNVGVNGNTQDYTYFPSISGPQPEGAVYYHQQPPQQPNGDGPVHLPPADVARMIPCRFFPACRYGASCMFLHPTGPYYPPPPTQYPVPYDPNMPPYPAYYPTPAYPPPPNGALMSPPTMGGAHPLPPPHPMVHTRSSSEVPSPASAHPYSAPPGPAPPMPYGPMSPISPTGYHHPVPMIPPMAPLHHSAPQSPPMYPNGPGPYLMPHENGTGNTYAQHPPNGVPYPPPPPPQSNPTSPDGTGHYRNESFNRRGGFRRPSVGRKPPCFFYPVGKCKNGDECRFPHIMPTDDSVANTQGPFSGKGLGPRRSFQNGSLEDKLRNMSIRENGFDNRGRYPTARNGPKQSDRKQATKTQRVPEPDEFPALAGSTPSRSHSPGSASSLNGSAPTAAQVLQRPAPVRRDGTKESSPERPWQPLQDKPELLNVTIPDAAPVAIQPLTFAAVATVA